MKNIFMLRFGFLCGSYRCYKGHASKLTEKSSGIDSNKSATVNGFLILLIVPSFVMSAPNVCKPQLTRQVCPVCAKFIQIRSSLLSQNNAIRIKTACMTLVKANCCNGIRMETEKSKKAMRPRDLYASLPFALI